MNPGHLEDALGQRPCFIKDNALYLRQQLQVVGALDQYSLLAGSAQASKEAQRNRDHQSAGAGDNQERQCSVNPGSPVTGHSQKRHTDDWRQHGQCQRAVADGRRIHPCKPGNKRLRPGLMRAGILHQLQNLRNSGLSEFPGCLYLQNARHVDAAADDLIARLYVPRQAFAGQCTGVQCRGALQHHTVNRHLLSGLHHDNGARFHLIRIHLLQHAVSLNVCVIRTNVHQGTDIPAAFPDRIALEQLPDLIEEHNGNRLVVIAAPLIDCQCKGADGRNRHQEILIKHASVLYPFSGLLQDVVSDNKVCCKVQHQPQKSGHRQQIPCNQHHRRDQNPFQHFLLFFIHRIVSLHRLGQTIKCLFNRLAL